MEKSRDQRVEELSEKSGGRFKLTALVQKRVRNYYLHGRTFMPNVENMDELVDLVLDQVERGEIELSFPKKSKKPIDQLREGTQKEEEEQ